MLNPRKRKITYSNRATAVIEDEVLVRGVLPDEDETLDEYITFENAKIVPEEPLNQKEIRKFHTLFKGLKNFFAKNMKDLSDCNVGSYSIRTLEGPPIYVPAYRVSASEREAIKAEVAKMLESGIIEPSNSAWSSPVLLIRLLILIRRLSKAQRNHGERAVASTSNTRRSRPSWRIGVVHNNRPSIRILANDDRP